MKKIFILGVLVSLSFMLNSFFCANKNKSESTQNIKGIQINNEYLIGRWIIPHNADINMTFRKDGTFIFVDYNTKLSKEEVLKGKYSLVKNTLTLNYNDRAKQKFYYYKGNNGDLNYYIKKKGYYFVKEN